ncbi:zinc finger protein ZAT9-like [Vitis vinifera]|uniref:zinc finger protein ZAT9-like n=1 Tax=Vitis vinifera TaxID=29760 RepID=UPI00053FCE2B|nr:zinc finger protein ZAT9-like [Vitis vinifera]|eukprot:XP_010651683.1 PREDICTED: zinc finger protein ZAT9-like [Vitis vinifera]
MAESVPCEGEERRGLGSSGLRENRLSLKPINIPMGGSDEGDNGKGRRAVLEARLECMISSKGLGCSKAFEGRMRARLDDQGDRDSNKNKTWNLKNGSEEAKCPVCSKSFHSKKAMHGHMRCHPEREWRGINPPPSTKTASCSSASQEIDGLSHASMTSTVVSSDISPSEPPLQWTKNGRRGQNRIINSYSSSGSSCNISSSQNKGIVEKHQVSERAGLQKRQQLKMLQVGNLRDYPSKKLKIHERGALGFRGQEDAGNKSGASWKDFLKIGFNLGPKEVDTDKKSSDDRIIPEGQLDDQIAKNTKKRTPKFVSYMDVSHNNRFLKTLLPRKYKCGTCNKTFPTYQALTMGNKYASSSHTAASEEEGQALGTSKHAKQVVQKSHKCRICNKSFPTGQALGGHQTTHRPKPAQLATTKQEASQNAGPRVLDFDLNELPPMEKE